MNNHSEQYPEEIKTIMDKGEARIARVADSSFSKWNTKIASYAKTIVMEIQKENEKRVKKSLDKLEVPKEKVEAHIKDILKPEMFELDLKPLKSIMQGAVSNEFNRIRSQINKGTGRVQKSDPDININIDWDIEKVRNAKIEYDSDLYNSIIDNRAADLADMLYTESVDKVSEIIKKATTEGRSEPKLMAALQEVCGFDKTRSQRIGRTEANYAANQAIAIQSQRIGIEEWDISTAGVGNACDDCIDAADKGPFSYDEITNNADYELPIHPSCRCVLQSVIPDEWLVEKSMKDDGYIVKKSKSEFNGVEKLISDITRQSAEEAIEDSEKKLGETIKQTHNELDVAIQSAVESSQKTVEKSLQEKGVEISKLSEEQQNQLQKLDSIEKSLRLEIDELKDRETVEPEEMEIIRKSIESNTNALRESVSKLEEKVNTPPTLPDFVTTETPFEGLPTVLKDRVAAIEKMIKTLTIYVPRQIAVSTTAPTGPHTNDLWVDIS